MGKCEVCRRVSPDISDGPGLCAACAIADSDAARAQAGLAHAASRRRFGLPPQPPRDAQGAACSRCVNACQIPPGASGYCGVRRNEGGRLVGGDADAAAVQWYFDPLPTNCVADWVCPAGGPAGHPRFTDTPGPEHGFDNLAVFYEACTFDCLFCQNWHYRRRASRPQSAALRSAAELAASAGPRTRCICFFGGDPTCQVDHALAAAEEARRRAKGRILRICWETNGSMSRRALRRMADMSLESGGCVKFDLKAWDDGLHRALCGVSNRRTLENFRFLGACVPRRPDAPVLVASTLMVPGYVGPEQVGRIAEFIAAIDPDIPYALLAFYGAFEMSDLPTTSRRQAEQCLAAARAAGLRRVRIGNLHLLS